MVRLSGSLSHTCEARMSRFCVGDRVGLNLTYRRMICRDEYFRSTDDRLRLIVASKQEIGIVRKVLTSGYGGWISRYVVGLPDGRIVTYWEDYLRLVTT